MEIVGREDEVAALHAFFDRAGPGGGTGPGALVLEGEAGIGKSTFWLAGVAAARERGLRVLSARPAEVEQSLAHTAARRLARGFHRRGASGALGSTAAGASGRAAPRRWRHFGLRRARQKRLAREAIEAALAEFEAIGAAGWAEKTRAELGRIGGRVRAGGLTPAERRDAALVAEGRTNREVAAALFLGERTVETHLSHIYSKLGIPSRTELARTLPS